MLKSSRWSGLKNLIPRLPERNAAPAHFTVRSSFKRWTTNGSASCDEDRGLRNRQTLDFLEPFVLSSRPSIPPQLAMQAIFTPHCDNAARTRMPPPAMQMDSPKRYQGRITTRAGSRLVSLVSLFENPRLSGRQSCCHIFEMIQRLLRTCLTSLKDSKKIVSTPQTQ